MLVQSGWHEAGTGTPLTRGGWRPPSTQPSSTQPSFAPDPTSGRDDLQWDLREGQIAALFDGADLDLELVELVVGAGHRR